MKFALTRVSANSKTGPIPTSITSMDSCPDTCELKENGCYAAYGPSRIHWNKVTSGERGVSSDEFLAQVKNLPKGALWRHNVAGDLPHVGGVIDKEFLGDLVKANKGKKSFTYTHHVRSDENLEAIRHANDNGFAINLSCNTATEAAEVVKTGLPVVCVLPIAAPNVQHVEGVKIVACPAEKSDRVQCSSCGLCADSKRSYVIGFRAHGTAKRKANLIAVG